MPRPSSAFTSRRDGWPDSIVETGPALDGRGWYVMRDGVRLGTYPNLALAESEAMRLRIALAAFYRWRSQAPAGRAEGRR